MPDRLEPRPPTGGSDANLRRGRLLVAAPLLADPNFERTVVLVVEHDDDGTVGLVLNRPSAIPVAEAVAAWGPATALAPPAVVFEGGPVSPEVAIGLGATAGERAVVGNISVVDLAGSLAAQASPDIAVRLFAGYAGWGPGQLSDEFDAGAWYAVDADPSDVLCPTPSTLWQQVLRRQHSTLRLLAAFPSDPSDN